MNNGETLPQILNRNKYIILKHRSKWIARAFAVIRKQTPFIKLVALKEGNNFENILDSGSRQDFWWIVMCIYKLTQEYVNVRKLGQDFKDFIWRGLRIHPLPIDTHLLFCLIPQSTFKATCQDIPSLSSVYQPTKHSEPRSSATLCRWRSQMYMLWLF